MAPTQSQAGAAETPQQTRRRFGDFILDTASQQLLREGRDVPLSPKAFRVLGLLVEHPDQVITKDRLLDEVWTDVHVLEGVVKVCIAEIRRALGETAASPRHLHTVQRRGYRFAGPVHDDARHGAQGVAPPSPPGEAHQPAPSSPPVAAHRPAPTGPESPKRTASPPVFARPERRQLTVIACDLVEREALTASLDADGLRDVLGSFLQTCAMIVRSLGGEIIRDLEEGLVVYFGYPRSEEDDAVRAVRAALRIVDRVPALEARLRDSLGGRSLGVAIGVHTGPAVVGHADDAPPELGETVDLASGMQASAEPGAVIISDATRRIVRGVFLLEERGSQSIGDAGGSLPSFRAIRATGVQSCLDVAVASELTPMVGREQETAFLLDRWERAREGQGQGVLLSGDAGMGKSRLVQVLRERIGEEAYSWLELRGSAFHRHSAFHPVIELLRRTFSLSTDDAPEEQVTRLEIGLEQSELPVTELLPFFAGLLSLPLPLHYPPLELGPEMHRQRTLEALCSWLLAFSSQQPVALVAEDLHWADPSTVAFLGALLEHAEMAPFLVVLTHRPEFEPPWPQRARLAVLPLHPLTRKQADAMVEQVAGGKSVPRTVREHVFAKADGVPLYIEELTQSLLESDLLLESDHGFERTDPLPELRVPSTLQDSLEARLDRLGHAKEVSLVASALGREFAHEVLAEVSPVPSDALEEVLSELVRSGLLYRRGVPPRVTYGFKHALIQETAYDSMLPSVRQEHHVRIARALESSFPELVDAEPENVARHYEQAGFVEQAIAAYERAGRAAVSQSAHEEAIAHLRRAIALVAELAPGDDRDQREIALQIAVGTPLVAARGFGNPEVEAAYGRLRSLAQSLGDSTELADALDGLVVFYISQSRLDDATEHAEHQLELAQRLGAVEHVLSAHQSLAMVHYFRGNPDRSLAHFERVGEHFDPALHREAVSRGGEHLASISRAWNAWALWLRGHPNRALAASEEAISLATEMGQPFSLAYALTWASVLRWNMRHRDAAIERALAAIEIAEPRGFPIPYGVAKLIWYRTRPDGLSNEQMLEEAEVVLARLAATGNQAAVPQILAGFGEFCLECSRPDRAPGYIDAALALSAATGQPHWDAEIHRAKGSLHLALDEAEEAEAAFRRAVAAAGSQDAKTLELRAATSLARLLSDRGRSQEALSTLSEVYAWFDEGFDTADLRGAKALLEELS